MYFPIVIWTTDPQLAQKLELRFPQLHTASTGAMPLSSDPLPQGTTLMMDLPQTLVHAMREMPQTLLPWLTQQHHALQLLQQQPWVLQGPPYVLRAPHGAGVRLSRSEALLLHVMAQAGPNTLVSRQQLHRVLGDDISEGYGPDTAVYRALTMRVSRLRRKALGLKRPFKFEAIAAQGYCLDNVVHSQLKELPLNQSIQP